MMELIEWRRMAENVKEYDHDICNDIDVRVSIDEDDYKSTLNLNTFITLDQLMSTIRHKGSAI